MRRIGTIAVTLIAGTTVVILATTAAVMIVVSSLLYHATAPKLGYQQQFQALADPVTLVVPSAVPISIFADSRELNAEMLPVSFSMLGEPSIGYFGASHTSSAAILPASFERTAPSITEPLSVRPRPPLETSADRINFDIPSLAPMAFVRFCKRIPQDCDVQGKALQPELVLLTKKRRQELEMVNRDVNRAIKPMANNNGVMAEEWLVAPGEGDCNDYAVTKRHNLLSLGWPSRSLLLAEAVVPSGEHHLVLVVRTGEGDFVLDNLNEKVDTVSRIPYEWVRAQNVQNPNFWSNINVTRAMRVSMNAR